MHTVSASVRISRSDQGSKVHAGREKQTTKDTKVPRRRSSCAQSAAKARIKWKPFRGCARVFAELSDWSVRKDFSSRWSRTSLRAFRQAP